MQPRQQSEEGKSEMAKEKQNRIDYLKECLLLPDDHEFWSERGLSGACKHDESVHRKR